MGYLTDFSIKAPYGYSPLVDYNSIIAEISEYEDLFEGHVNKDITYSGGSYKWYNCDEDMKKVSGICYGTVFWLRGEGEDFDDIWEHYYYKGLSFRMSRDEDFIEMLKKEVDDIYENSDPYDYVEIDHLREKILEVEFKELSLEEIINLYNIHKPKRK